MNSFRCAGAPGVMLLFAIGCGGPDDELPRAPVSGAVTLDDRPLASGRITFQPPPGAEGTPAGGAIAEGEYAIPREEGPTPGEYVVRITTVSEATVPDPDAMPGDPPPLPKEPIPQAYNLRSTLKATITPEGPNTFDFDMKTRQ